MSDQPPLIFEARLGMGSPCLLRQILRYDELTGLFVWLPRPASMFSPSMGRVIRSAEWSANKWNSRYSGKPALTKRLPSGYLGGSIFNKPVRAHRVAWAMHWDAWPKGEIDHINGRPDDNRIQNLRDVTHGENMKNQRRYVNNASGTTGVSWYSANRRWVAEIQHDGERHSLGSYQSLDDAIAARLAAERHFGFHENHGGAR